MAGRGEVRSLDWGPAVWADVSLLQRGRMTDVRMVSRPGCVYCERAAALFAREGIDVKVEELTETEARRAFLDSVGARTFPQIFVNDVRLGGYAELQAAAMLFARRDSRELRIDADF